MPGAGAAADTTIRLALIGVLPMTADDDGPHRALREVLALARTEGLSTSDAADPELAMHKGLPLASKDKDLVAAAGRCGVASLPRRLVLEASDRLESGKLNSAAE